MFMPTVSKFVLAFAASWTLGLLPDVRPAKSLTVPQKSHRVGARQIRICVEVGNVTHRRLQKGRFIHLHLASID